MYLETCSLSGAIAFYARLVHVPDLQSAEANRLSGLELIREALRNEQSHGLGQYLALVHRYGAIDSRIVSEELGITMTTAASQLKNLWREAVWVRGREQPERLFLERSKSNLPEGGWMLVYRLSDLGKALMAKGGAEC